MIKHSRSRVAAVALAAATLLACGKARQERTGESAGLRLELLGATVNANRQVEVRYRVTDQTGKERGLSGITNNWTLASLSKDAIGVPMYVAYVRTGQQMPNGERQPGAETENASTGSADLGGGTFRYVFKQQLPEGYDPAATYRVGVYSRLQIGTTSTGAAEYDPQQPNAVLDFVPDGGTPQTREIVSDAACSTCHGEVRAHGGFRRGVQICTTCHTTQLYDPDSADPAKLQLGDPAAVLSTLTDSGGTPLPANPLDLGRLVHRIHRGRQLQTVQNTMNAARGCTDPTNTATGCPTTPPDLATRQAAIAEAEAAGVARYHVVGFQNSDNVYGAAAVRTENGVSTVYASGVNLPPPNDVRNCVACHDSSKGAKDADQHLNTVERRICTACHADVWFNGPTPPDRYHILHVTNVGPLQFPSINDASCAGCHAQRNAPAVGGAFPLSALEFGRFVDYAHTVPLKSQQLRGLDIRIVDFTNAGPGQKPTITFKVLNGDGSPVLPASGAPTLASPVMASIRATVNGPTQPDYVYWSNYFQEDLAPACAAGNTVGCSSYDAATQTWTHVFNGYTTGGRTFSGAIPDGATGTWAVAIEARRTVTVPNPDEPAATTLNITEGAVNPIFYFTPQGGPKAPRQLAVKQEKCNACHLALQFHGGQRDNVEYCVMCHTPDLTDFAQRPKVSSGTPPVVVQPATVDVSRTPDAKEERSVHLKAMIHRIHMGSGLELQKPYVIFGNGGSVNFFDEGGLPETARNRCDLCHEGDAYKLESMPAGRLPTIANETATPVHTGTGAPVAGEPFLLPMTAACISCHDTQQAVQHALNFQNQGTRTERCLECHGDRGVRAVSRVHPIGGQAPTE